jgi:glycosyltransferase involved in cell wall biosynthesis
MARGLMNALSELGDVDNVSDFRSRDGEGDADVQAKLIAQAETVAENLIAAGEWDAWVTYHNYYKAPDLIGQKVCAALDIPYHLIEASRASKRLSGPWETFAERAEAASDAACVIYYFTEHDHFALDRDKPGDQRLVHLKPFLDREDLPILQRAKVDGSLLAVGMFRNGDKVQSYANLAASLNQVATPDWTLDIVGAGAAEREIRALFAPFGQRVSILGELSASAVTQKMQEADVFVWPGVNEAFGMVYIEAQANGTPVLAEDRPGVRDVVGPNSMLTPQNDEHAFAAAIDEMLSKPRDLNSHRSYIADAHLRGAAVATLRDTLTYKAGAA